MTPGPSQGVVCVEYVQICIIHIHRYIHTLGGLVYREGEVTHCRGGGGDGEVRGGRFTYLIYVCVWYM